MQHEVKHEVYYDGAWVDVSSEVHEPSGTQVSRGVTAFGDLDPATIEWTFEDPGRKWVPGNPLSPLYGKVSRAMPARVTIDGAVRGYGEAAVFEPDRTLDFDAGPPQRGRAWVAFRADGLLARIGSWSEPLRSPMYRAISNRTATLVGHWPMEDGREATQLTNTVPGGAAGAIRNMVLGEDDTPAGASSTARFVEADNTSRIDLTFLPASATAGWQLSWSIKMPALPGATTLQVISWRTSDGCRWLLNVLTGTYQWKCIDSTGALVKEVNVSFVGTGEPDQWVTFRMKASRSGGTVTAEFAWYVQGQETAYGITDTFTGTIGYLVSGTMNGNAYMQDTLVSHVFGVTGGTDDLLGWDAVRAFDGYVGERAADRFSRLMDEVGLGWSVTGDAADTVAMGRQRAATLADHLREIAATDRCLIYDSRNAVRVALRTRADLYRQTPTEFVWPDDIAPPLKERYDYVGVTNRVTASQAGGGEATAALESGPMSVQPAPDGIGERKSAIDVNVADEDVLADLASWEVAQGTVPGARFPSVMFDLDARPDLAAAVTGLTAGSRITISGYPTGLLDLIVLRIGDRAEQTRHTVTLTCAPGEVFSSVGAYDSTSERYDSASTTLKADVTATATALTFRTADEGDVWDTTAVPYDVVIAGEQLRVTAMGAASLVSGAYDQAATVTRSINGVVRALTAGAEIHVANPGRYGL